MQKNDRYGRFFDTYYKYVFISVSYTHLTLPTSDLV